MAAMRMRTSPTLDNAGPKLVPGNAMRIITTVCLVLALSACAVWSAGKDPHGQALMQNANAVLAALNSYIQVNRKGPATLQDLVPGYIAALPAQPEFNYSVRRGSLVFNYAPSWPTPGTSACEAHFGDTAFRCADYR